MLCRTAIVAVSMCLAAGAAFAQQTNPPVVDMPIGAQLGRLTPMPETLPPAQAEQPKSGPAAVTVTDIAFGHGNDSPYLADPLAVSNAGAVVVAGTPVADTPQTRRMYRPLSRAGRISAPAGN
jgi:hypothetical protein